MTKRGRGKQRTEPGEKREQGPGKADHGNLGEPESREPGKIENKIKTSVDKNEKIN